MSTIGSSILCSKVKSDLNDLIRVVNIIIPQFEPNISAIDNELDGYIENREEYEGELHQAEIAEIFDYIQVYSSEFIISPGQDVSISKEHSDSLLNIYTTNPLFKHDRSVQETIEELSANDGTSRLSEKFLGNIIDLIFSSTVTMIREKFAYPELVIGFNLAIMEFNITQHRFKDRISAIRSLLEHIGNFCDTPDIDVDDITETLDDLLSNSNLKKSGAIDIKKWIYDNVGEIQIGNIKKAKLIANIILNLVRMEVMNIYTGKSIILRDIVFTNTEVEE